MVVATILAFLAAAYYGCEARRQVGVMENTYREIQDQTKAAQWSEYYACRNAQAAQGTLIQLENGEAESRAVAGATIAQAAAEIGTNGARISFRTGAPFAQGKTWAVPFHVENEGKSTAFKGWVRFKAVFVEPGESLPIDSTREASPFTFQFMESGAGYPSSGQGIAPIWIKSTDGRDIDPSSKEVTDFSDGIGEYIVIGQIQYSDFAGVHYERFCYPVYDLPPGKLHHRTRTERACAEYGGSADRYYRPMTLPTLASPSTGPAVTCVRPPS